MYTCGEAEKRVNSVRFLQTCCECRLHYLYEEEIYHTVTSNEMLC